MAARAGVAKFGDGQSTLDSRIGQQGDLIVSELHGRYYEQAVRRNIFFSTSLVRATSIGATAQIGNIIWNPPDSQVNLVMLKWASNIVATSAACTGMALGIGYQTTSPTTVTAADATGCTFGMLSGATNVGFITGKAKAFAIATLLFAPVSVHVLYHNTAAINTVGVDQVSGDLEGMYIIPPGGIATMQALGAAAAASAHSSTLTWEEVPVL